MRVGFVGSSHLSLVSSVCAARALGKNNKVFCIVSEQIKADHNGRASNFFEPQYWEVLEEISGFHEFTTDFSALKECDIVYIAVDTPTDEESRSDYSPVEEAFYDAKPFLSESACVVIHSQVFPGFTRKLDFDKSRLFYHVETLVFGNAMERAIYPERFILGAESSDDALPKALKWYLEHYKCPILQMNYESAELAKISINLFLTASVSTTNMLAEISENIGANWDHITTTLRLDKRIGKHAYLAPGLGISGGNLERDLVTIAGIARENAVLSSLVDAEIKFSEHHKNWCYRKLRKIIREGNSVSSIGILGLSYKAGTNSLKNSPSVSLIESIGSSLEVYAYDPIVKSLSGFEEIKLCDTAQELMEKVDVLAIMTPWEEFKEIPFSFFNKPIIDPYSIVCASDIKHKLIQRGKSGRKSPLCLKR